MRKEGFYSCKVVQKESNTIIGLIDFRIGEEAYISLIMVRSNIRGKGVGNLIYKSVEEYIKSYGSTRIRIDVVTGYDEKVTDFWRKNEFRAIKDIKLNWDGKVLDAIVMKKYL